jgi:hypothetical protein
MASQTRCFTVIIVLLAISFVAVTIIDSPAIVGAQSQNQILSNANANVTGPHKVGVKIIYPSQNSTVPVGRLIINGTSSDTPTINCKVFADWNDLKPMQNVTAKGQGGPNDYSRWTYTYNESYHNITAGINELTSKITCYDDTTNMTKKYYSLNVTGS